MKNTRVPLPLLALAAIAALLTAGLLAHYLGWLRDIFPGNGCEGAACAPDSGTDAGMDAGTDPGDGFEPIPVDVNFILPPASPDTDVTRMAGTAEEVQAAVDRPRTRVRVAGTIDEPIFVHGHDTVLELAPATRLERVFIEPGTRRVEIRGGSIGSIEFGAPIQHQQPDRVEPKLWVTDVRIEDVHVDTDESGIVVRGHRVRIERVRVSAGRFAVYVGDTLGVPSEDVLVTDSELNSMGGDVAVGFDDILRSAVVRSHVTNRLRHCLALHGNADQVVFGSNVLVGAGARIGTDPGDAIQRVAVIGNAIYQRLPETLTIAPTAVLELELTDNVAYSDVGSELARDWSDAPEGWEITRNRVLPFREPPTR